MTGKIIFILGLVIATALIYLVFKIKQTAKKIRNNLDSSDIKTHPLNEMDKKPISLPVKEIARPSIPLPAFYIDKSIINHRVVNYLEGKHTFLSRYMEKNGFPQGETRTIWYSKELIEALLDEINYYEGNGVRVYMGQYDEDAEVTPGQLCLIPVLTRASSYGDLVNEDIIAEDEPDFASRMESLEYFRNESSRAFNFGGYNPPHSLSEGEYFPYKDE